MAYTLSPEDIKRCRAIATEARDRVRAIAVAVARSVGIPVSAIYGPDVQRQTVAARHLVMYLAHMEGLSYPIIGRAIGRDHTTVMDAVKREKARRALENKPPTV